MLLIAAYCLYAAWFIYRTSFTVNGVISMGYAETLALGHGLVWNPGGERVEGYTNLLWVLAMAMLHLLPLGKATISLAVQVTSARLLVAHIVYVRSIAEEVSGLSHR